MTTLHRFGEIVEQISSRQINLFQGELLDKLHAELKLERKQEEEKLTSTLDAEINIVKGMINDKMQKVDFWNLLL